VAIAVAVATVVAAEAVVVNSLNILKRKDNAFT